ncbi:uncharacterized protein [Parasteatoda tepidariorum]|uniref:uncharacterized protein n=1 Tax=Parasteatoda tepidariorum TaxID=114398 RepID=UPI0039BD5A26
MELVPLDEIDKEKSFYHPHHFVIKEDSSTTKLRVVFDASAKDSNGNSLNSVYRLLTVTYGTAWAPFLAVRTLKQLANNEEVCFPEASKVLKDEFYVDDLLSGADSIAEAKQLVTNLNALLERGGFNLRKWASYCPEVLNNIPDYALACRDISIKENQSHKILGLFWNFKEDTFQVKISQPGEVLSKRNLLSVIAKIYDPLGFLSPTTIVLKIMLQNLWKNKLPWDEPIPEEVDKNWKTFHSEMEQLRDIKIKRRLMPADTPAKRVQLHGFCDASIKAYSAVFYIHSVHDNEVTVNIMTAKTRVAPLKAISLPRLELCTAHLLSKLFDTISRLMIKFWDHVFLWTDSEIVLSWLRSDSLKDQFVRNRVAMITSLTASITWNHVSGHSNPADCAYRGIFPRKLMNLELWWQGSEWLSNANSAFTEEVKPNSVHTSIPDTLIHASAVESNSMQELTQKYSSFSKLIRVIAWCKRFVFNSRNSENRISGCLQVCELDNPLIAIIKEIQSVEFSAEIKSIKNKGCVPVNSKIITLSPFLDSDKVLRIGGRLKNSNLSLSAKHPILLPRSHHVLKLLIEYYHKLSLHSGISVVLSLIRQKFWFPAGRNTVRKILRDCTTCLKAVHLELVSDLSTEAFLASFRRFTARRWLPSDVYSDNATNFKGATTPHFGGLWESNIKSTKRHLLKVCCSATLNFEELATLLCQVEACLNSQPLCPLTSEISDLEALTPGHFIVGAPLLSLSERDPSPSMCLKSRWSLIQKLRTQFWIKWSKDYLQTLQAKSKWTVSGSEFNVGDLVLLKMTMSHLH